MAEAMVVIFPEKQKAELGSVELPEDMVSICLDWRA